MNGHGFRLKHILHGVEVGELAASVLNNYFQPINIDDSNRSRCTVQTWWAKWIETSSKMRLTTPGSGKTYDAILKIVANLKRGRVVCTNIEGMELPECQQYLKDFVGLDDFQFSLLFRVLTKDEVMRFWKTEKVERLVYSGDSGSGNNFPEIRKEEDALICPVGSLIIIDEVHKYYNARDWQATASRELGDWASTHRHFGYDLVLITQSIDKVDKQVRTLTEWTYFFRKVNFLGSMVQQKYIKYSYSGDDHDGKALAKNVCTYDPKIYPCYKSYSSADAKEVGFMTHVNILKHPIFFAIPIVICLCLYMFSKSSFATGDILGAKKIQARQDAVIARVRAKSSVPAAPAAFSPSPAPVQRQISSSMLSAVASVPPVWPVAAPVPKYSRYHVEGWIQDNGQYIISFAGVTVRLPHPDVLKFNRSSNSVMAATDVFGAPVGVSSVPSIVQ